MSDKTVGDLINMLRDAVDLGTGQVVRTRFGVRADVAGKTGTTQKNTDGWFILMHPRLVAGSWVGFNDSRVTMRSNYWGEGGHNAVLLVGDFFQHALGARLIDGRVRFPYARPRDSTIEPYLDAAKDWFDTLSDWIFGNKPKARALPPLEPRRDLEREAPRPQDMKDEGARSGNPPEQAVTDRQRERQRLLDLLSRNANSASGSSRKKNLFWRDERARGFAIAAATPLDKVHVHTNEPAVRYWSQLL